MVIFVYDPFIQHLPLQRSIVGLTPTFQRTEGFPFGECVRATYASILDLPIESVPRFDPASLNGEDQRTREREWLASIGYDLVEISTAPVALDQSILDCIPPVKHLISGISPRGFGHRCVGFAGKVLFDPHPSRAGLVMIWSVGLLVKVDS